MLRTQVQLTEAQAASLKRVAVQRDASVAELVREAVDEYLARHRPLTEAERRRRFLAVAGRFRSGHEDVSARHDEHFARSIQDWDPQ